MMQSLGMAKSYLASSLLDEKLTTCLAPMRTEILTRPMDCCLAHTSTRLQRHGQSEETLILQLKTCGMVGLIGKALRPQFRKPQAGKLAAASGKTCSGVVGNEGPGGE